MQTLHNSHSTRITKEEDPKPKKRFPLAYVVLVLSFCTFAGSIWFLVIRQEGRLATAARLRKGETSSSVRNSST